ncbi:MAG: hypothetical protein ACR2PU_03230 [Gammaproteobacteria bacterium]
MKRWRKIVIFTMILALPISMWASVSMASHCQSSDDTSHSEHMHDQMSSQDSNDHANCDCGCDGGLDCSVSGCSASVISNSIEFDLRYLTQSVFLQAQTRVEPSDPNLLFRPPISLS